MRTTHLLASASMALLAACGGGTTTSHVGDEASDAGKCQFNQDADVLAGINDKILSADSVAAGVAANRESLQSFAIRTAQTPTHYKDAQVLSCLSMSGRAYGLLTLAPQGEGNDPLMAGEKVLERANAICAGERADPRRCAVVQAESMVIGARRSSKELSNLSGKSVDDQSWTAVTALVSDLRDDAKVNWAGAVASSEEGAPSGALTLTRRSLGASACRAQFATTTMMNTAAINPMDEETRNQVKAFNLTRLEMLSEAYKALYRDAADEADAACFGTMDDRACQNRLAGKMTVACQAASDVQSGGAAG